MADPGERIPVRPPLVIGGETVVVEEVDDVTDPARPDDVVGQAPEPDARRLASLMEEQFGPALPIVPFDDEGPLVDQLNAEWAGLCSSVWSADLERAGAVAARLRTGTTWVNCANAVAQDTRAPFGGFRQSGVGRELGVEGLFDFTEPHTVTYPAR